MSANRQYKTGFGGSALCLSPTVLSCIALLLVVHLSLRACAPVPRAIRTHRRLRGPTAAKLITNPPSSPVPSLWSATSPPPSLLYLLIAAQRPDDCHPTICPP